MTHYSFPGINGSDDNLKIDSAWGFQQTVTFVAGEKIEFGDAVVLDGNGVAWKAKAGNSDKTERPLK